MLSLFCLDLGKIMLENPPTNPMNTSYEFETFHIIHSPDMTKRDIF